MKNEMKNEIIEFMGYLSIVMIGLTYLFIGIFGIIAGFGGCIDIIDPIIQLKWFIASFPALAIGIFILIMIISDGRE